MTLINQWIQVLESGEYQQCQYALYDGEGYCCLGVAAKIMGYEFLENSLEEFSIKGELDADGRDITGAFNKNMLDKLGIDEKIQSILIDFNDDKDYDFKQIADWIRKNVKTVD